MIFHRRGAALVELILGSELLISRDNAGVRVCAELTLSIESTCARSVFYNVCLIDSHMIFSIFSTLVIQLTLCLVRNSSIRNDFYTNTISINSLTCLARVFCRALVSYCTRRLPFKRRLRFIVSFTL
jgi:ABC-type maltose transport system permease subunit